MNFPKLICQTELTSLIPDNINEQDLNLIFLDAIFNKVQHNISNRIIGIKFKEPHYYRFELIIHAQEKENET